MTAAVPEVFYTAHVNLFMEAGLQRGESVLIHGGASGVGTAAIQLARESGCRVLVTAGTDAKTGRCSELGADLAVNYRSQDFVEAVLEHTAGAGVDVILDIVGADYLQRNLRLLKQGGRMVLIALMGGSVAEIDLAVVLRRRLRLLGSVLRPRSLREKVEIKESFMERFWPQLVDGTLKPIIDSVYPIEEAGQAHLRMAANENIGKIVLDVRA